jgi:histone deacetylase 6
MRRRLLPTGYVYDVFMSFHATPDPTEIHPEDPRRIFKIYNILAKNGILAECKRIKSRKATRNEILLAHTPSHYQSILDTACKVVKIHCRLSLTFFFSRPHKTVRLYGA